LQIALKKRALRGCAFVHRQALEDTDYRDPTDSDRCERNQQARPAAAGSPPHGHDDHDKKQCRQRAGHWHQRR
jgi:hypothetical protein